MNEYQKQGINLKFVSEADLQNRGIVLEEIVSGETTCIENFSNAQYLEGVAKVLKKEDQHDEDVEFYAGEILVTRMTDPSDMPFFVKSSAIVTDEGGITCHAAIESNRLGIACITQTEYGSQKIKSGEKIYLKIDPVNEEISRVYREVKK